MFLQNDVHDISPPQNTVMLNRSEIITYSILVVVWLLNHLMLFFCWSLLNMLTAHWLNFIGLMKTNSSFYSMQACCEVCVGESCAYVCVCIKGVRRGVARVAGQRKPCGVCAGAVGSCHRQSRGPEAYCTPRPPPRSPRPPRPAPCGWPVWSLALRHFSSSTWCVCSETTPEHKSRSQCLWVEVLMNSFVQFNRCILFADTVLHGKLWQSSMNLICRPACWWWWYSWLPW